MLFLTHYQNERAVIRMDSSGTGEIESIDQVIHRKKEPKKETKDIRSIGNRTVAKSSTQILLVNSQLNNNSTHKSIGQQDAITKARRHAALKNAEIDEYLNDLVIEGMLHPNFISWGAKCIHTLGLQKVNIIVINARNGNDRQRLLAVKLKGAMQLHFKRQYFETDQGIDNTFSPVLE
jgi:hypothetical protein